MEAYRNILRGIAPLLDSAREREYAALVREALRGDDRELKRFLISNTLWVGRDQLPILVS